jgi:GTPase SAR1 family protein
MKTGDGFLCVYSIVDKKTFDLVKEHHDSVMRVKWETDDFPFVLVGNKSDMDDNRQVSHEMGVKTAKDINVKFLETSAKTGKNVHEAFHEIVREIKKWRQLHPNSSAKTAATPAEKKKKRRMCQLV